MKFHPKKTLLDSLAVLKSASIDDIILHVKPESSDQEKSLKTAIYPARDEGLIYARQEHGNRTNLYSLTEKGKAKQEGREFTLGTKVETINSLGVKTTKNPSKAIKPRVEDFGCRFDTNGKLIIWRGDDEVVFDPPVACQIIAFVANQLPWIEYCQQNGFGK